MTPRTLPGGFTPRQLFVLLVAYLGWVFDLMDVFLMVLVKDRAMAELLGPGASPAAIGVWGGWALASRSSAGRPVACSSGWSPTVGAGRARWPSPS